MPLKESAVIEITAFRWVPDFAQGVVRDLGLVAERPLLAAYLARGEARPAFKQALADQLAPFHAHQPEGAMA